MSTPSRDFTVAVFVVHQGHVLLHPHRKSGLWLPPGGHIETGELPDEAAVREVMEEASIAIELLGGTGIDVAVDGEPKQLTRPEGIQLEDIGPDHQHIDLIYFARIAGDVPDGLPPVIDEMVWCDAAALDGIALTHEVRAWVDKALATVE